MPRKKKKVSCTAMDFFNDAIDASGYDNSMGDYNDMSFDFIDEYGLADKFREYMNDWLENVQRIRREAEEE